MKSHAEALLPAVGATIPVSEAVRPLTVVVTVADGLLVLDVKAVPRPLIAAVSAVCRLVTAVVTAELLRAADDEIEVWAAVEIAVLNAW